MQSTDIEKPYKIRLNIRPIKIAYFVKENDPDSLARIFQLSCTQWGGLRHLIIPVLLPFSIWPLYADLLKCYEPDTFVNYLLDEQTNAHDINQQLKDYLEKLFPYKTIKFKNGSHFEKVDPSTHALRAISQYLARNEQMLEKPVIRSESQHLINLALFGKIHPDQINDYHDQFPIIEHQIDYGSPAFWSHQMRIDTFASPINLTDHSIRPYRIVGRQGFWAEAFDHFDIVIGQSVLDLCLYWNLRFLRETSSLIEESHLRRTISLPINLLENIQSTTTLFQLIKDKLFVPGRKANLDVRFYVASKDLREKSQKLLSQIPMLQEFREEKIQGNTLYFGKQPKLADQAVPDRKLSYAFTQVNNIPSAYYEGIPGNTSQIELFHIGTNEFRFEPPRDFFPTFGEAVVIDFECDVWKNYPKNPQVANRIKEDSYFSKYGVSQITSISSLPHFQSFYLPTTREALSLYFESKGFEIRSSRVEQYSNATLSLIGGLQNLRVVANKPAHALLDKLSLKSTKKVAQRIANLLKGENSQIEAISDALADLNLPPELKGIPRTFEQMKSISGLTSEQLLELVEALSEKRILQRGYYFPCPNCGVSFWYPLQDISEFLSCRGCFHNFLLPIRESANSIREMQPSYRLNTLLDRAFDQDIIVSLLAVHYLTNNEQIATSSFGLKIFTKDGKELTDFDFLVMSNQQIYGGECKTGSKLEPKDFQTAKLAAKLGLEKFYFCSLTQFDEATLNEIQLLQETLQSETYQTQIEVLSEQHLFITN
ncbi:MAG: hypothetical protein R3C62_11540 [Chloroflexota bacterium]